MRKVKTPKIRQAKRRKQAQPRSLQLAGKAKGRSDGERKNY